MRRTPLSMLAHWAGGSLHGEDVAIDGLSNDSRAIVPGSLYLALRGERFDGHEFAAAAQAAGAAALLVERLLPIELPQLLVDNSEQALARIAAAIQADRRTEVFAITGSNGKTSVKTLLSAILGHAAQVQGRQVYATPGNRNNEIGLPLAVIDAPEDADWAIYEMGAGKPGDIEYLTAIAPPRYALVNNIAAAHLERMGSLLGVADTKGAIYRALPADGVAVINADEAFAPWFEQHCVGIPARCRVLRFGLDLPAEVTARAIQSDAAGSHFVLVTPAGQAQVQLALPGRHNVANALAAASLALAAGVPLAQVAEGLGQARPVAGRQVAHTLANGAVLVDDSYNANPGSLAAAIASLAASGQPGWLVLGDMRELGPQARALHAAAGEQARSAGLARLWTLGELADAASTAFGEGGRHFASHAELAAALAAELPAAARCLVKGSRGSAMDKIVSALLARDEGNNHVA